MTIVTLTSPDSYFEDFAPGQRMRHVRGKTIGENETVILAHLTMNTAQGHFNAHDMAVSKFGRRITYGGVTASIIVGLASEDTSENALADVALDKLRLKTPVVEGDTLVQRDRGLVLRPIRPGRCGACYLQALRLQSARRAGVRGRAHRPPAPPSDRGLMQTFPPGALDGIGVIDLTQVLAGPFCTQILADHGAEVLKVEPLRGDETRRLGPYRADDELRAISGYYQSVNRNKKSIALDLKSPEGRQVLLDLIDGADAVVENSRGGVMERLDLSYELLSSRNPKLVYAAIRGFGDPRSGESPYAAWPAFDIVGQAMGGMMGITGPDANTPIKVGPGVGDLIRACSPSSVS